MTAPYYFTIVLSYCTQYMKGLLVYRADFFFQFFSDLLSQAMNLAFILVVFQHIELLEGWGKGEILFIYGFFLLPYACFNAFFSGFFEVPEKYILKGELDRILTRPVDSLLQVIMEQIELESLSGLLTGILILLYSYRLLDFNLFWWDIPILFVMVISATLIYGGIYIALASLAFWFEGKVALMPTIYNLSVYGRYPTTIYKGIVRFALTWVLPFAFVGFYPAALIMKRQEFYSMAYLTPLMGTLVFVFGASLWYKGIRRYCGTGS